MREHHAKRIDIRAKLYVEQDGTCVYCHRKIVGKPSLDHIVPVDALDDPLGDENLVVTCVACNKRKGNHTVFLNLYDKEYYPMIDIPYFFQARYIQYNHKDRK